MSLRKTWPLLQTPSSWGEEAGAKQLILEGIGHALRQVSTKQAP
jgi:hypothetical protein